MQPPVHTATDYLWQFQRLLPRGRIWQRGWGTVQAADLLTLMPTWARLDARAADLIVETFPCTTTELLSEWEASLGLPDPCTGPLPTLQQRQAAVCAKFVGRGGSSREYYIHLAASLGFQIEINTYAPFYASRGQAGDPLYDEAWAYAWNVTVYGTATIVWFRASVSAAGEPLAAYGDNMLRCLLETIKPAHTDIIWNYLLDFSGWDVGLPGGPSIWDAGDSIWDEGAVVDG